MYATASAFSASAVNKTECRIWGTITNYYLFCFFFLSSVYYFSSVLVVTIRYFSGSILLCFPFDFQAHVLFGLIKSHFKIWDVYVSWQIVTRQLTNTDSLFLSDLNVKKIVSYDNCGWCFHFARLNTKHFEFIKFFRIY